MRCGGEIVVSEVSLRSPTVSAKGPPPGTTICGAPGQDARVREPGAQLGRIEQTAAELDDDGPGHEAVGSSSAAMSPRIWTSLRAW